MYSYKSLFTFIIAFSTVVMVGCTSVDQYGQERTSRATYGTGIGAASGAAIGAAISRDGRRTEGALIGAAAGALLGGGIGYSMDQRSDALYERLRMSGIETERQGNQIVLSYARNIYFDENRSELRPEFSYMLDNLANILKSKDFKMTNVLIKGHAESYEDNKSALSQLRADSVADYLHVRGVGHIRARGYADTQIPPYGDDRGNRRVDITLSPISG